MPNNVKIDVHHITRVEGHGDIKVDIENGEIKTPGTSVRIVHNLPILLQNISAIGDDSKNVLQWASLPSIAPTVKAEGIKVIPI